MAFMKKFSIIGIFISILTVFAMSQNVSAITGVFDIDNYSIDYFTNNSPVKCSYDGTWPSNNTYWCELNGNRRTLQAIEFPARNYNEGDIVQFDIVTSYDGSSFTTGETPSGYYINPYTLPMVVDYNSVDSLDVEPLYSNDRSRLINYYIQYVCNSSGTGQTCTSYPELTQSDINLQAFRFTFRITRDVIALPLQVKGRENSLFTLIGYNIGSNYSRLYIVRFHVYRLGETRENKEVEEKTQSAVDDSQNAGSSSSSSAQQGGANLLSAITGFFGVITSASPTNCVFNAPLNTYFGNQRLNVDLCALDLPREIGALTSIIAIGILIPFAIHMFNKFIALFRSFQS